MFNTGGLSELKVESKIGKLNRTAEEVFGFLSDFNNFTRLMPPDKVKNWQASKDKCSFSIENAGDMGLEIVEKEPYKTIKMKGTEQVPYRFFFWIQLKELESVDTRVKLTIKASLNPIVKGAAKAPLQSFVDALVDQLEKLYTD